MNLKASIFAVTAGLLPFTVFAGPDCSSMKHDHPMWEIVKSFEEHIGTVKLAKVTSGNCFEIYGYADGNKKVEIYYNPTTGKEISRK